MRFSPQGKPVHGANGARENASAGSAVGDDANAVLEPRFGGDEPWHGFPPGQTKRCSETGRFGLATVSIFWKSSSRQNRAVSTD